VIGSQCKGGKTFREVDVLAWGTARVGEAHCSARRGRGAVAAGKRGVSLKSFRIKGTVLCADVAPQDATGADRGVGVLVGRGIKARNPPDGGSSERRTA